MQETSTAHGEQPSLPHRPAASSRRVSLFRRWPVFAVGLIVGGGLAWLLWRTPTVNTAAAPLSGKLLVYVRPPERASEPQSVEKPGATPVVAGGNMSLEVHLDPPGYAYLVWFDNAGQVLPLYPWNSQHLDVKDIQELPPERRPARLVYSPLLGGGWTFGEKSGPETVLFLARRTPLPNDVQLGALLAPLSPTSMTQEQPVVMLGLDGGARSVSVIHPAATAGSPPAAAAGDPLAQLLLRLQPHFELIRAVRFAHE
jgi:hypothetical protein